jgi:hypothetical protein
VGYVYNLQAKNVSPGNGKKSKLALPGEAIRKVIYFSIA